MTWLGYALMSAVAAAITAILAKLGVEGVLAALWLREPLTWQVAAGVALMAVGAVLTRA